MRRYLPTASAPSAGPAGQAHPLQYHVFMRDLMFAELKAFLNLVLCNKEGYTVARTYSDSRGWNWRE